MAGLEWLFPRTRLVDDMSWDHNAVCECDWVPGCFYLIRREVIEQVGLFDPRYFLYCEEVDHCWAVREAGWSVTYYPYTQVVHTGGESAKADGVLNASRQITKPQIESQLLFFRKRYGILGLLSVVLLQMLVHAASGFHRLVEQHDAVEARAAIGDILNLWRQLLATRLGSRETL
jgi:N-acetylglucosaminyl-diphospho-decaprenol L-rhamnosyltransferase